VVNLELPDEEVRARLARRAADGRIDDADLEVLGRRLRQFRADTAPLIDLYWRRGILTTVDASTPPEAVRAAILDALGAREPRRRGAVTNRRVIVHCSGSQRHATVPRQMHPPSCCSHFYGVLKHEASD
jgi:hypothetical protein